MKEIDRRQLFLLARRRMTGLAAGWVSVTAGKAQGCRGQRMAVQSSNDLQQELEDAAGKGSVIDWSNRSLAFATLRIGDNTIVNLEGSTLTASGTEADSPVVLITGNRIKIVGDFNIDLANVAHRGIAIVHSRDVSLAGKIRIYDAKTLGKNPFNGGLLVQESTDVEIGEIIAERIRQSDTLPGLYRALSVRYASRVSVKRVAATHCDMGVNLNNSSKISIDRISVSGLSDNGLYLIGNTTDVAVGRFSACQVEEGVVLNCLSEKANVSIGAASVRKATNKGVSLRSGGGYRFGVLRLDQATVGESMRYVGVSSVTVLTMVIRGVSLIKPLLRIRSPGSIDIDALVVGGSTREEVEFLRDELRAAGIRVGTCRSESKGVGSLMSITKKRP